MDANASSRCPVCRAKFRGTRQCSRCGADISRLMILSVSAQHCRTNARKSLLSLEFEKAHVLAAAAQKKHATDKGRKLLLLTSWLNAAI